MVENMMVWAGQTSTAVWVLAIAGMCVLGAAVRESRTALWGDLVEDDD